MNLEELLENNIDLEDYLEDNNSNKDFLINYYLQNPERINLNFMNYSQNIPIKDRIELINILLAKNVKDGIVSHAIYCTILFSEKEDEEILDNFYKSLIDRDKIHEINIDNFDTIVKSNVSRADPIYFLKKNPENISYFSVIENDETLIEVLDSLTEANYTFTKDNEMFVSDNILTDNSRLEYFINNSSYTDDIKFHIAAKLKKKPVEDLAAIYINIDNDYFKEIIASKTNFNNFNLGTTVKDFKIYVTYDNNLDDIINFLEEAKSSNLDSEIVVIMDRVDMVVCEKLYSIYGDKFRICPLEQQNAVFNNGLYRYKDYSFEHIKKCEYKIDSFVECMADTLDKDGEVKSLSPLEKYIAAYIIVSNFANYRPEDKNEEFAKSRSIYEVFGYDENPKIVCVGYVRALKELLYRMDMKETAEWEVYSPTEGGEYKKGFNNHDRLLISLKDPKYNVDGVYMADPTWDSSIFNSKKYSHLLMTKDELTKVDTFLKPEFLRLDQINSRSEELNCVPSLCFNNKIPNDTLIKAFMAVNRFLDKNQKMAKSDSDYTKFEYDEISKRLGFEEDFNLDKRSIEEMTGEELAYSKNVYDVTLSTDLRALFKDYLQEKGIDIKISLTPEGAFIPLDEALPFEQLIENGFVVDLEKKRLFLDSYEYNLTFKDKTIKEFFDHELERIGQYQSLVNGLTNESEVKTK